MNDDLATLEEYSAKLEKFRRLCIRHDLTYAYSDDHRYWVAGQKSWAEINEFSKEILPDDAATIWNEIVDMKLTDGAKSGFYTTADRWLNLR